MRTQAPFIIKVKTPADSGEACLATLQQFYNSASAYVNESASAIQTKPHLTTPGSLCIASQKYGLEGSVLTMEIEDLIKQKMPVVLQMMPALYLQYYVVCFGASIDHRGTTFLIGDPSKGLYYCTAEELSQWWVTGEALLISPGRRFSSNTTSVSKGLFLEILKPVMPALSLALFGGILISFFTLSKIILYQQITKYSNTVIDNFLTDTILLTGVCIVLCSLLIAIIRHGTFKHQNTKRFSKSLLLDQSASLLRLFNSSINTSDSDTGESLARRVAMVQVFSFGLVTEVAIVIGLIILLINSPVQLPLTGLLIVAVLVLFIVGYNFSGIFVSKSTTDDSASAPVPYRFLLSLPVIIFIDGLFVFIVCMLPAQVFDSMGHEPVQLFTLVTIATSLLTSTENLLVIVQQLLKIRQTLSGASPISTIFTSPSLSVSSVDDAKTMVVRNF